MEENALCRCLDKVLLLPLQSENAEWLQHITTRRKYPTNLASYQPGVVLDKGRGRLFNSSYSNTMLVNVTAEPVSGVKVLSERLALKAEDARLEEDVQRRLPGHPVCVNRRFFPIYG